MIFNLSSIPLRVYDKNQTLFMVEGQTQPTATITLSTIPSEPVEGIPVSTVTNITVSNLLEPIEGYIFLVDPEVALYCTDRPDVYTYEATAAIWNNNTVVGYTELTQFSYLQV